MELTRQALIDRCQSKVTSIEEFNYDMLTAPPLSMLLSQFDIDKLYYIATSVKYSGNPQKKYKAIDDIMRSRGFTKLAAGTNRITYRFNESNEFVVKVAADAVGIGDNPREFKNQFIFKPFVTKVFEVSPCGTVGVFERVNPITSREEFLSVADDIYDVINEWFIGKYIMADIGTKFFMNWGIRHYNSFREGSVAFGPVLLDFPYVYELDGSKLYCSAVDFTSETGRCGGLIDYDDGFNFLVCTKCGVKYRVKELAKKIKDNEIVITKKGRSRTMKVGHYNKEGKVVGAGSEIINEPVAKVTKKQETVPTGTMKVSFKRNKVEAEVVEKKPAGNNRGNVKAPEVKNDNEIVADEYKKIISEQNATPTFNELAEEIKENNEYKFASYDAEYDIVTLTNGDKEITAKLSDIIPDDEKQSIIEASDEYSRMQELSKDVDAYKLSVDEKTEEIKKLKKESKDKSKQIENLIKEKEKLTAEKDKEIANWIKATESATSSYDDTLKVKDTLIKEQKKLIEDLEKELAFEPEASQPVEPVDKVIKGIPEEINENYEGIDPRYYGDARVIDGITDSINGYSDPEIPGRQVIVFPINPDEGEYLCDPDGNIIAVASINGYTVDELMFKKDNE